jgi:hypothetical protein
VNPGPVRAPGIGSLLAWTSLAALALGLCLQQIVSTDYWWLLSAGRLIAETGSIPRADVFTYTAPGAGWIDIHWLFQLGLWGAFQLGGHAGAVIAKLGLVLAMLAFLAPIGHRSGRSFLSVGSLGLMLLALSERNMVRPEAMSWALLAAILWLLDRFERRPDRWVWVIVPLELLWANVHGLFVLGLALCAMHLLAELARPLGDANAQIRWSRAWTLAGVIGLGALATLGNPNGLDGSLYPLQQLAMVSDAESRGFFGRWIEELKPVTTMAAGPLLCFVMLLILSGASLALNWRTVHIADVLQWSAFLYLAAGARRNAALFAIVAAPLLVRNANRWLDAHPPTPRLATPLSVGVSLILALLALDAARGELYPRMSLARVPGAGVELWRMPVAAADWLERNGSPGPLAHGMADGGFLIWRLYPDVPVMADGRLEVFGAELFEKLIFQSPEAFERLDAEYHFGAVIQRHGAGGAGELLEHWTRSPEWHLVAVDDSAALFVRGPGGPGGVQALDLDAPDVFPPLDPGRPGVNQVVLRWRTGFLSGVGRDDLALEVWGQMLQLFPEIQDGAAVEKLLRERAGSKPRAG